MMTTNRAAMNRTQSNLIVKSLVHATFGCVSFLRYVLPCSFSSGGLMGSDDGCSLTRNIVSITFIPLIIPSPSNPPPHLPYTREQKPTPRRKLRRRPPHPSSYRRRTARFPDDRLSDRFSTGQSRRWWWWWREGNGDEGEAFQEGVFVRLAVSFPFLLGFGGLTCVMRLIERFVLLNAGQREIKYSAGS